MSFLDPMIATGRTSHGTSVSSRGARLYAGYFKRALDVTLVAISLPVVLPLIAVMALLVAFDGGNPFYSQLRIGRANRVFRIWKLRTMVKDADEKLRLHLDAHPEAKAEWASKQKLSDDPRITLVGWALRKSSMDELPQLLNVLRGDMSLVGPRPMMVDQKPLYPGRAYFALRPGITGTWQVSDRNASTFAARADFDQDYYDNLSFGGDVHLLMTTVSVVLRGTGC